MRAAALWLFAVPSCGYIRTPNLATLASARTRRPAMSVPDVEVAATGAPELKVPTRVQLIVEPTPFTHVSGYANRYKEYLKYQKKAGSDVSIITPDDSEDAPDSFLGFPVTTVRGFRFILYPVISMTWGFAPAEGMRQGLWRRLQPNKLFQRRANKREYFSKVSEVIDEFEPEIVHVTSPGFIPYMATYIAREWKDIPLLLSYHTHIPIYSRVYAPWMGQFGEWISWSVIRQIHAWADLTVVTSPQMKEEFEAHGIQRVEVWNKGIDTDIFHPKYGNKPWWTGSEAGKKSLSSAASGEGEDAKTLAAKAVEMRTTLTDGHPDAPLLIYVGRLGVEKRLRDLKQVLAKLPGVRLAVVGKGPDMEALKEYFAGTPTVFTGLLSGTDLSRAFAAADIFVMPSDSETLGFVVLESMASGVPVIGCNRGGIPSLIDHEDTGYLYEPGDAEQAAAHVKALLDDRTALHAMSARARAEAERWGWEAATTRLREEQYLQAVRNHAERQKDVRTLRQKLVRYREAMTKGMFADFFAFFGDRDAEATSEALEAEEWELCDEICELEKKASTRQLFGAFSARSVASDRFITVLLFPARFFTALLRKLAQLARSPIDGIRDKVLGRRGNPPPALDAP